MLFDFDDILIEPELITSIMSRNVIDVTDEKHMLPLFTAPMDTVVDETNSEIFNSLGIYSIIPRKKEIPADYYSTDYKVWYSYGLEDFKKVFIDNFVRINPQDKVYALIDVANGHMDVVKELCHDSKKIYDRQLVLMVGNCANPLTFLSLSQAGADYVRMGIGNGCFIPGSQVKTKNGIIPIEEIKNGDLVLTHNNRYMEVTQLFTYDKDEEIILINGIGSTKNHEYYVIEKKYQNIVNDDNLNMYAKWITADLLDEKIHLLIEF